ncbi:Uma2 family endonuclease [Plantactinospora sp. GCM10030261]|uniref:Uma2 family endonuclease n=1 Tax=Plantactinospora sp. GCM10030261 TaxID=3273420 RepID=UPI0036220385
MAQPVYEWRPREHGWREQDLLDLPGDGSRYEIIDGSLHVTPPADLGHHRIAHRASLTLDLAVPPGWLAIREIGLRLPGGNVIPDISVVRDTAPDEEMWADPKDVALVVEVESPSSRRHDRITKPGLYAEAGIESYWRIERTDDGPVAHVYQLADAGHYELFASVGPADSVRVERPFPVDVTPADWLTHR